MSDWVCVEGGDSCPVEEGVMVDVRGHDGSYICVAKALDVDWGNADFYRLSFFVNDQEKIPEQQEGEKFDRGKDRFSLVPLPALQEVMKVLEHGAEKYDVDNWRLIDDFENRYYDAIFRHLFAYKNGEVLDKESGVSHLAHAACGVMFLLNRQLENRELE